MYNAFLKKVWELHKELEAANLQDIMAARAKTSLHQILIQNEINMQTGEKTEAAPRVRIKPVPIAKPEAAETDEPEPPAVYLSAAKKTKTKKADK